MANLNKVFLMGNLTRDPELRYVPSGRAVTTFTVAVNRVYKTQTGEQKEIVSFIRIVVWGRRAKVCGEYLSKGSPVFIEGRLQSRSWDAPDGQKRSTIEVIADNVQFLRTSAKQRDQAAPEADEFIPGEVASINLEESAPKSGKETREDIANAAKELPGKAKEALEHAKEKVEAVKKEIAERRQGKTAGEAETADKTAYDE